MLSKKVENTVGKGEICRHEQCSPFPIVFSKKRVQQTRKHKGLFGKGLAPPGWLNGESVGAMTWWL